MPSPETLIAFFEELQKIASSHGRMEISKTRTGRRPISVHNLLAKDKDGTLFREGGSKTADSMGNPQDVRGDSVDDPGAARPAKRRGEVPTFGTGNIPQSQKLGAAAKDDRSFGERNPNLSQYMKATGGSAAATGAGLGLGALMKHQAEIERPGDAAMMEHLTKNAPVPVFRPDEDVLGGAHFSPGSHTLGAGKAGGPAYPHVKVPQSMKNPSILAHELGHADLHGNMFGRAIQNTPTMLAGGIAPMAAGLGGFASGFSDDKRVRRAGVLAPLALTAPQLLFEAGASLGGLRRMRQGGAGAKQLFNAGKELLPAWGTYAARTGAGVASAAGSQAIGSAVHDAHKRKQEKLGSYRLTDSVLPFTNGEDMRGPEMPKPRKRGDVPTRENDMNKVDRLDARESATTISGLAQRSGDIAAVNNPSEHS